MGITTLPLVHAGDDVVTYSDSGGDAERTCLPNQRHGLPARGKDTGPPAPGRVPGTPSGRPLLSSDRAVARGPSPDPSAGRAAPCPRAAPSQSPGRRVRRGHPSLRPPRLPPAPAVTRTPAGSSLWTPWPHRPSDARHVVGGEVRFTSTWVSSVERERTPVSVPGHTHAFPPPAVLGLPGSPRHPFLRRRPPGALSPLTAG